MLFAREGTNWQYLATMLGVFLGGLKEVDEMVRAYFR